MTTKKRGLGRGFEALLGGAAASAVEELTGNEALDNTRQLAVDCLRPGRFQPRREMNTEKLKELADSISAQGVVQPVVVRPLSDDGQYEIIAGERRWRAAQIAGLQDVPVIIRHINDQAALAIALIENIQRENLNPLEEAEAFRRLANEFDLTHQQVADAIGRSRASITNTLRLNDLQEDVKNMLLHGDIEMGHARALLGLELSAQLNAADKVVSRKLTVRATEALVQQLKEARPEPEPALKDPDIRSLEESLATRIGAQVLIRHGNKGSGQLIIRYDSLDQLEGVLDRIR
ncbi:MAG: ParB/RepB/Spo0J family partition protein [Methylococcaceae bacterium]